MLQREHGSVFFGIEGCFPRMDKRDFGWLQVSSPLNIIYESSSNTTFRGPDEQIVIGLASHLRKTLSSTWCLSESGVCGPSRPDVYRAEIEGPGYCAFAVVGDGNRTVSKEVRIPQPKSREENMVAMAEEGLKLLLDTLKAQE